MLLMPSSEIFILSKSGEHEKFAIGLLYGINEREPDWLCSLVRALGGERLGLSHVVL
jgi:hypothetical protein